MACKKCGDSVGSPPENCTDICRRGCTEIESSRIFFTSSNPSSCTKPTWFASMKHGSHIMLQRLVRSTVSTDPRPYWIDELPCSRSGVGGALKSRPG